MNIAAITNPRPEALVSIKKYSAQFIFLAEPSLKTGLIMPLDGSLKGI